MRRTLALFLSRWGVAYLLLYMLPFPVGQIPGLDELWSLARQPWIALVAWVGEVVFAVEAVPRYSGSGDTAYNYVEVLCLAALAFVAALVWPRVSGARMPSGLVMDRVRAYACIYLGGWLLIYGCSKAIPVQFSAPGADRLVVPYGDSSPMGLMWTFMGASAAYQIFAGLAEVASGVLLFWRRTRLLGGLLAATVLVNVVAMNYCYDVAVKLFSSHLLAVTLFVLAPELRRLVDLLWFHRAVAPRPIDPHPLATRRRRALTVGKLALLGLLAIGNVVENYAYIAGDLGAVHPLSGVYRVEAFTGDDTQRWLRVGLELPGRGAIQRADGGAERLRVTIDEQARTLTLQGIGESSTATLRYTEPEPGVLWLRGRLAGVMTTASLRREQTPSLLLSWGFHWVQEQPFNR